MVAVVIVIPARSLSGQMGMKNYIRLVLTRMKTSKLSVCSHAEAKWLPVFIHIFLGFREAETDYEALVAELA